MARTDRYAKCLIDAVKKAGPFGKERIAQARQAYERYRDRYVNEGDDLEVAAGRASEQVLRELEEVRVAKLKAAKKHINILADMKTRLDDAEEIRTLIGKTNQADKLWHGLKTVFEDDVRIAGHTSIMSDYSANMGKFWSLFRDSMEYFSKGTFGTQRGKIHFNNIVRELFLEGSSGDQAAKDVAQAFRKFETMYVNGMNETAVTLRKFDNVGPPTHFSAVDLSNATKETFVNDMLETLDWNRTLWPNGAVVAEGERRGMLELMYDALRTNDYSAFPKRWGELGGRFAKEQESGRILQFKDANAWLAAHDKYGGGVNIFDVVQRTIDKSAYNLAVAKVLGNSPDYMYQQLRAMTKARANATTKGKNPARAGHLIDKHLRRADAMSDTVLRHNPMDPESALAATIQTTSNLATSAMLKAAVFLAVPGDLLTSIVTRMANHQPVIQFLGEYMKAMFPGNYRNYLTELVGAGFVADDFISNNFIASRFGAGQQFGPAWSRRIADTTMRASLMSRHTTAIRAANQREMMLNLARYKDRKLADIPENVMFKRAGITEAEWDRVRAEMKLWEPINGVRLFRPGDMVDRLGHDLTNKFQSMIWNESRRMVISTSVEGSVRMRAGLRPESAAGAFLHSASMFHGYPVTALLTFSRLIMTDLSATRRTAMIASLGLGGALVGAFGMQLRNLSQGKELHPMDTPEFWLKAFASGGSLGLWGDFVTGAMRSDTRTQTALQLGGPIATMVGELNDMTLGTAFQWMQIGDRTHDWTLGGKGSDIIDFARRNVIPQTWLYSYVLERDILENLQESIDPAGTRRTQRARVRRAKEEGSPYRRGYEPGTGIFTGR